MPSPISDMTGRSEEGLAFLQGKTATWAHCNNFRLHVWWHLALLHLDQGAPTRALALYDAEVRRDRTDDYRDIANAASLLIRLELEGVDVGNRWEELADPCAAWIDDGCLVFADLHYMLALCGGERGGGVVGLLHRMQDDALKSEESATLTRDPGAALAQGLRDFRDGAYGAAFVNLSHGRVALSSIGGSRAQRDLFERLTVEAAIRAGHLDAARALIDERSLSRGHLDRFGLERARVVEALVESKRPARARRRVRLA